MDDFFARLLPKSRLYPSQKATFREQSPEKQLEGSRLLERKVARLLKPSPQSRLFGRKWATLREESHLGWWAESRRPGEEVAHFWEPSPKRCLFAQRRIGSGNVAPHKS